MSDFILAHFFNVKASITSEEDIKQPLLTMIKHTTQHFVSSSHSFRITDLSSNRKTTEDKKEQSSGMDNIWK